jgi:ATP-dependent exoDNAse (exonuclease V) beta subunit
VAESQRLLYVALTRARDYLIVSGEAGQGSGKGTWRHFVEAAAGAHPELLRRVAVAEAGTAAIGPALELPEAVRSNAELTVEAPAIGALAASAQSPAVRLAVTDLAEYARCPRRHFLSRYLALPERLPVAGKPVQDDPSRATARGTLAHAMLSEVDLAAPPLAQRAQLGAAASRRGYDEASPAVRRILRDVTRFLDSPAGRRLAGLAQRGGLRREVPFLMRLDAPGSPPDAGGARCYLSGAIDAIAEEKGGLVVIDFKYALPAPGAAEKYRIQLLTYALAATRALPGKPVRASLQYLRGSCASVDVTPSPAELAAFAQEAPRLAAAAALGREGEAPEALGRTEERCRGEGCGYVFRCYPRRGPERAGAEQDDPDQVA